MNNINIAYSTDDHFVIHTATSILSACANASDPSRLTFYILTKGLTRKSISFLTETAARWDAQLQIVQLEANIDRFYSEQIPVRFHPEKYFRLFIPELLPQCDKIIYLDADTIVRDDISLIYDRYDAPLGVSAVKDWVMYEVYKPSIEKRDLVWGRLQLPPDENYYNSGLMLMNLEVWRTESLAEKLIEFRLKYPEKFTWHDQDAINGRLTGRIETLPVAWNVHSTHLVKPPENYMHGFYPKHSIQAAQTNPKLIHYITIKKPWVLNGGLRSKWAVDEYWKYRQQLPGEEGERKWAVSTTTSSKSKRTLAERLNRSTKKRIQRLSASRKRLLSTSYLPEFATNLNQVKSRINGADNLIIHVRNRFSVLSETFVYHLIKMQQDNYSPVVLCKERLLCDERPFENTIKIPSKSVSKDTIGYRLLASFIKNTKPKLIHGHFSGSIWIAPICKDMNIPLLISFHGSDVVYGFKKDIEFRVNALKLCNETNVAFTVPSQFLKGELLKQGFAKHKIQVLPNTYDQSLFQFNPEKYRTQLRIPGTIRLAATGRLIELKGHQYILQAMAILNARGINSTLTLLGGGKLLSELRSLSQKLGLSGKVFFKGDVPHKDIPKHLQTCDLFIQPSIVDPTTGKTESFGIAALEAATLGLPVIASNIGGLPEVVAQLGHLGSLFQAGSADSLAQTITQMTNQPRDIDQDIDQIMRVRETFSEAQFQDSLYRIYRQLMNQQQPQQVINYTPETAPKY